MKTFLISMIFVLLNACSTPGRDLVEDGTTRVDMSASKKASVIKVNVNQDKEHAIVKGLVVRANSRSVGKGYVIVDLYDKRGVRIDSINAKINYARRGSKSAKVGRFKAELEEAVPENSHIVVRPVDNRLNSDTSGSDTISLE